MAKKRTGLAARQWARERKAQLAASKADQEQRIEALQVEFFTAQTAERDAEHRLASKIEDLEKQIAQLRAGATSDAQEQRSRQRDSVGRILDDERQSIADTAVLLDLDESVVRSFRKEYRATRKASASTPRQVAEDVSPTPEHAPKPLQDQEGVA